MIYKIQWCEIKKEGNTNGRDWKITNMTLEDPDGNTIDNVSTFDPVMAGHTIDGIIEMKGEYKNFKKTLQKPEFMKRKEDAIGKAMDKKEASITTFQGNKENSIKVSSTMRDAVLLAIAQGDPSHENVLAQRAWLYTHFDDPTTNPIYPN